MRGEKEEVDAIKLAKAIGRNRSLRHLDLRLTGFTRFAALIIGSVLSGSHLATQALGMSALVPNSTLVTVSSLRLIHVRPAAPQAVPLSAQTTDPLCSSSAGGAECTGFTKLPGRRWQCSHNPILAGCGTQVPPLGCAAAMSEIVVANQSLGVLEAVILGNALQHRAWGMTLTSVDVSGTHGCPPLFSPTASADTASHAATLIRCAAVPSAAVALRCMMVRCAAARCTAAQQCSGYVATPAFAVCVRLRLRDTRRKRALGARLRRRLACAVLGPAAVRASEAAGPRAQSAALRRDPKRTH